MRHTASISSPSGFPAPLWKIPFFPVAAALLAAVPALRAAPGDLDPSFSRSLAFGSAYAISVAPVGEKFLVFEALSATTVIPSGFFTRHHEDGSRDSEFTAARLWGEVVPPPPWLPGLPIFVRVAPSAVVSTAYFNARPADAGYRVLGHFDTTQTHYYPAKAYDVTPSGAGYPGGVSQIESGSIEDFAVDYNGDIMVRGFFNKPAPSSAPPWFTPSVIGFPWADHPFTLDTRIRQGYGFGLTALRNGDFLLQIVTYPASESDGGPKFVLHRVHGNGELAVSYEADSFIGAPAVQPDGQILVPGSFTLFAGKPAEYLVRLKADGSVDDGFAPNLNGPVSSVILQSDGKILVGGRFSAVGGVERRYLARLNADGALDTSFAAPLDQPVNYVSLQANGKVFAATAPPDTPESAGTAAISRHFNDPAVSILQRPDRSTVRWLRGGSAPEVQVVTVDFRPSSTDEWRSLGKARRIAGGWELNDESLPEGGEFSAKGWILGDNRRTGWVEATLTTAAPALTLDQWRTLHFGSPDNAGGGADGADPDGDGLPNLTEYVFGSDPQSPSGPPLPAWTVSDDSLECHFNLAPGRSPLGITAEWATHPASSSWQTVEGQADGTTRSFKIPLSGRQRIFARFRISAPQ
ncbi:MAG: hypothetical protein JWM59_2195 [Verrucomicrobiales bacterium]|nr:hypothetical protein [Verrucomicrobiales bacterium]